MRCAVTPLELVLLIPLLIGASTITAESVEAYQPTLKDKYEWLVPLTDQRVGRWVHSQNEKVEQTFLSDPSFPIFRKEVFDAISADDFIAPGVLRGDYFYNLDKNKSRKLGLWRRIRFESLMANNESQWEPILDLDKLSADEGKVWTFKRETCLGPAYERCLA